MECSIKGLCNYLTIFLEKEDFKISMDGKKRAIYNIWIEGFWKCIRYNYIYLIPSDNGIELFEGVKIYIKYYNQKRHQIIKKKTNDAYHKSIAKYVA